jgi:hypothetical protein
MNCNMIDVAEGGEIYRRNKWWEIYKPNVKCPRRFDIQSVKSNMNRLSYTPNCYSHYCNLRINTGIVESSIKSAKGKDRICS